MYSSPEEQKEKRGVALSSVFAAVLLTATKLTVGLLTGSLGILSEALHSALDLIAAVMTFFAVKIADKPADKEHNYGHGKVENLSALEYHNGDWKLFVYEDEKYNLIDEEPEEMKEIDSAELMKIVTQIV